MKKTAMILILATTLALPVSAGQGRGNRHQGRQARAEFLQLTPEQKQSMKAIRQKNAAALQSMRKETRSLALQYRKLKEARDPRAEGVRNEILRLRDEAALTRLAGRAEMESLLTSEQRQKI